MAPSLGALRRFFRAPKGLLIALMVAVTAVAAASEGLRLVAPGLAAGVLAAMLLDAPILRWREGEWIFPDGALLTGLIIAMVLSPHEAWWIAAVTSIIAIASKYLLRVGKANVFNPAALALVITFYAFDTGHSWWGSLPEAPPIALVVLFATGIFITNRVNKTPLVLSFLGVYYLLVTTMAFVGQPGHVAELYRVPDLNAALYFSFFMLTDPPTSPPKHRDQVVNGLITAAVSFAAFEFIGAAYFLLAGLLAANVCEAWRRWRSRRPQASVESVPEYMA
jgi:Na+-translocating ferredoxin:NAD+ oxidoreductase RnfD subunit